MQNLNILLAARDLLGLLNRIGISLVADGNQLGVLRGELLV